MEGWKEVQLSYIEYFNKEYFNKEKLRNLLFPINFNNFYFSNLSDKSKIGVKSIEKNILELVLIYFKICGLYSKYKETDTGKYIYILKTELEYFILRYRLVINKLESLEIEFKKYGFEWVNTDYFIKSVEYIQLLGIRNDIAHEGIRSQVFYTERIKRESFQFYTNRSLDNNIYLHEAFLNPYGSEIYDLKLWITWMIVLLFNFMDDTTKGVVRSISNKYDTGNDMFKQIKQYDALIDNKFSMLIITNDEIHELKNGVDGLTNHIIKF